MLLQQLTKSNAAIQKIVAFENAFERLLDIITEEGSSDGGKRIFNAESLIFCNYDVKIIVFLVRYVLMHILFSSVQVLWSRTVCCFW